MRLYALLLIKHTTARLTRTSRKSVTTASHLHWLVRQHKSALHPRVRERHERWAQEHIRRVDAAAPLSESERLSADRPIPVHYFFIDRDDPRNAASIADNVGDNVGDCAGMAADLFETYAVTVVATMLLAAIFFTGETAATLMLFPLVIGAVCIVASVIGTFFVKLGTDKNIMWALYKGFISSAVISAVLIGVVIWKMLGFDTVFELSNGVVTTGQEIFYCALVGLVVTGLIIWVTEYYTSTEYRPVRSVAKSSETSTA